MEDGTIHLLIAPFRKSCGQKYSSQIQFFIFVINNLKIQFSICKFFIGKLFSNNNITFLYPDLQQHQELYAASFLPTKFNPNFSSGRYPSYCMLSLFLPISQQIVNINNILLQSTCQYLYYFRMSFRQSFTRGGNQNLQYDDAASQHFFMTVLILVFLPLLYSILKSTLFPFSNLRSLKKIEKQPHFKIKIQKYKTENKFKFFTCGYIIKLILLVFVGYLIFNTYLSVRTSNEQMKGFDPYEILQVSEDASVNEIRKSYRKLALQYHPDRNDDDPQSAAMFIMISKAYQCLTDEKAKENCMKFGNPEGTNSFSVGIALPQILVRKENQVKVMLFVLIIMVIIIPSILIYFNTGMENIDEEGAMVKNHPNILKSLNENLSFKNVLSIVSTCWQFEKFPTKSNQIGALQTLFNQISSEDKQAMNIKRNYYNFFKKSFVLIDAQMNSRKIPAELSQNFSYVLKTVPKLMNSIISLSLPISTLFFKLNPHPQQNFVGITALQSLILFQQRFIQGCNFDSPQVSQLNLTPDELDKVKKKRKNKIPGIRLLQQNQEELDKFLSLFEEYRKPQIKKEIFMFPQVQVQAVVYTPGEQQINDRSLVQAKVIVSRKNPIDFVISHKYSYLKQERWYLFIVLNKAVLHYQKFNFEGEESKEFKYNHPMLIKAGPQEWKVILMPDSYFGFDIEVPVKFQVSKAPKQATYKPHPQDAQIESNQTMFSRMLNNLVPQEDQELSDTEKQQKDLEEIPAQQQ